MNMRELRSFILSVVKPLKNALFSAQNSDGTSQVTNLVPDGGSMDGFRHTSPVGFISGVPQGKPVFFQALFGSGFENIILAYYDPARPQPEPGQAILYSTDASGTTIKAKISLNPDGTISVSAPGKITVIAPEVDIGSGDVKKALLGEVFQETFNNHTHIDAFGLPTNPPTEPSAAGDLSTVLKTT